MSEKRTPPPMATSELGTAVGNHTRLKYAAGGESKLTLMALSGVAATYLNVISLIGRLFYKDTV
ncbi:uncharacterized protein PHACADRAFT_251515 [Phanerochaete carnosa HHB-10118-sp]|uniref:Uncharacterized protein n=1 Tax=Phanerochaete carnosa (strain HHB-10118-sp) TaxID=650164 RepID=K5W1H9_PHACS|nr:uncharacterized protein PHACADRAFT_251515 [Phanerochaete carnosa HHB-10118-sp]EKM57713.1 hypothetical protein PHACADRAFT_251515 [Phanerochaete carnosa HHB-10118-sp]